MKRVNTKTSKKIVAVILAAVAAFAVTGCSVKSDFTKTETHTVVDADGNRTTTTTTNHNGEKTTETTTQTAEEAMAAMETDEMEVEEISDVAVYENVPIAFSNEMGWDIAGFFLKMTSSDEWTDNYLDADQYIDNGVTMNGITVTYDEEDRFLDVCAVDSTGEEIYFESIELPAEGADHITVSFEYDEVNDAFTATAYAD